jgi:hypothetical protein
MWGTWRRSTRGRTAPKSHASGPALALGHGQRIIFPPGAAWIIGRAGKNAPARISISRSLAPRNKACRAAIFASPDGFTVEDLGSQNESSLNGERLSPGQVYPLAQGDRLALGALRCIFLIEP